MILGKIREIRDQSPPFLKNTNFWESLPRAPNFKYPSLFQPCFNLGQILNQAKVAGLKKVCHADTRCNFFIFVSKIKCSVKKRWSKTLWLFVKTRKFRVTLQSLSRHTSVPRRTVWETLF